MSVEQLLFPDVGRAIKPNQQCCLSQVRANSEFSFRIIFLLYSDCQSANFSILNLDVSLWSQFTYVINKYF